MLWWRRLLVLTPVLAFLGSAMLLSCGGGSSGTAPTATPTTLLGLTVCFGPPATGTAVPTITPTVSPTVRPTKTPTPSPTPICSPTATSTAIGLADQLQLNAQGIFSKPSKPKKVTYRDITNSPNTAFRTNGGCNAVVYQGNGLFIGNQTGCCCIGAQSGSIFSQQFSVNVNGAPACAACPQPPTTPTPAAEPRGDTATSSADNSGPAQSPDDRIVTPGS
jgi:hypothetical protein